MVVFEDDVKHDEGAESFQVSGKKAIDSAALRNYSLRPSRSSETLAVPFRVVRVFRGSKYKTHQFL